MNRYLCKVTRKQTWDITVEAMSESEAQDIADSQAAGESPHDDYAYSTEADLIEEDIEE